MNKHHLPTIKRNVARYLRKDRTARTALVIMEAAQRVRLLGMEAAAKQFAKVPADGKEPPKSLLKASKTLRMFGVRIEDYADQLAEVRPTDPIPTSVRPLLFETAGAPFDTPDFLTPFAASNTLGMPDGGYSDQLRGFMEFIDSKLGEEEPEEEESEPEPEPASWKPWFFGGALLAGGAFLVATMKD